MRKSVLALSMTLVLTVATGSVLAKPVVINYWGVWDGAFKDLEKDVVDSFNKQYEGRIFVKASAVPGDSEGKTITAQTGGVGPDVFKLDRFKIGSWAAKNLLENLDPMIKKDKVDPDSFYKPTWNENVYGGKVFGMPWNTDARGMYYNKTLFKQAGLNPDAPPKTWDEVKAMARKIDFSVDGKWQRVGFLPHSGNWYFSGWLWAAGGEIADTTGRKLLWNSSEGLEAAQFEVDAIQRYGGPAAIAKFTYFNQGKIGAWMDGSFMLQDLRVSKEKKFDYGVAYPPRPEGLEKTPISWSGGYSLVIPRGTKHPKEAWEFIKFYTMNRDIQTNICTKTNWIPALKSAANTKSFLTSDPHMHIFTEMMPTSRFRPVIPAGWEVFDIYVNQLTALLVNGKKSPKDALNSTVVDAQKILDRAWARVRAR